MRQVGVGVGVALAVLSVSSLPATACGLLWPCSDRAHASRSAPYAYRGAHGYRGGYPTPARADRIRGYRGGGWAYGYTSPARARGYPYAAWSSASIPPTRWYVATALPGAKTSTVGLTPPVWGANGLPIGGMPARGPTLFGPDSVPSPAWGRYYKGSYYRAPAYGYIAAPLQNVPPQETPSWWVEPRRRR